MRSLWDMRFESVPSTAKTHSCSLPGLLNNLPQRISLLPGAAMGAIPICCSEEKSPDGDHETMVAEVAIRASLSTCMTHQHQHRHCCWHPHGELSRQQIAQLRLLRRGSRIYLGTACDNIPAPRWGKHAPRRNYCNRAQSPYSRGPKLMIFGVVISPHDAKLVRRDVWFYESPLGLDFSMRLPRLDMHRSADAVHRCEHG